MKPKKLGRDPLAWINASEEQELQKEEYPSVAYKKSPAGRPQTIKREIEKSSQEGLPENWTRATFIIQENLLNRLKNYAYMERRTLKDVVNEMVQAYLAEKEQLEGSLTK